MSTAIDCPIMSHYFQSYLEEEYSSENLLCYRHIKVMNSIYKDEEKALRIEGIYTNFIQANAELEVNIDSAIRTQIEQARAEKKSPKEMEPLYAEVATQLFHNLEVCVAAC